MGKPRTVLSATAIVVLLGVGLVDVGAAAAKVPTPRGVAPAAANGGWGEPVHVDPQLTAVSCASARFCAAVDHHGEAVTYKGSKWSTPTYVDQYELRGVSCVSSDFCVAVGPYAAFTYNGSVWSSGVNLGGLLEGVSCVSTTYCVAIDTLYPRGVYTFDGTSWAKTAVLPAYDLDAVSCASETRCVAVGDRLAFVFDGTTWVGTKLIPHRPRFVRLASASCVAAGLCMVADDTGKVYIDAGGGWSGPTKVIPTRPRHGYNVMTCANANLCVMVSVQGQASFYEGKRWSKPQPIDPPFEAATSVACGPATFCMAVNYAGYAIPYNAH